MQGFYYHLLLVLMTKEGVTVVVAVCPKKSKI